MKAQSNLVAICMIIALAFTGQSMAAARGASDATGQMTLCVGAGTVVVYMDDSGTPTQAPHFCPECTLIALENFVSARLNGPIFTVHPAFVSQACHEMRSVVETFSYLSRAPPVLI